MAELISVRRLMEEKNPERAARIPSAAYALLGRIAHEREVNAYIVRAGGLEPREALDCAMKTLGISSTIVEGSAELLSGSGRITVAANHPHGGADALILLELLTRCYGEAVVPANDLVRTVSPLASFFAPINKHGSNREHYRRIDALFASDKPLLMFPAGRTGRPEGGGIGGSPITDFPWTGTFIKKSRLHGRSIVPVHIRGRNSRLFYTVARLRGLLKIRMNLEMLLLVDELMKQRGRNFEVIIGQPIDSALLGGERSVREWAEDLRGYVQALGEGVRDDFFSWLASQGGTDEMA
jgi:putative hemolysin